MWLAPTCDQCLVAGHPGALGVAPRRADLRAVVELGPVLAEPREVQQPDVVRPWTRSRACRRTRRRRRGTLEVTGAVAPRERNLGRPRCVVGGAGVEDARGGVSAGHEPDGECLAGLSAMSLAVSRIGVVVALPVMSAASQGKRTEKPTTPGTRARPRSADAAGSARSRSGPGRGPRCRRPAARGCHPGRPSGSASASGSGSASESASALAWGAAWESGWGSGSAWESAWSRRREWASASASASAPGSASTGRLGHTRPCS